MSDNAPGGRDPFSKYRDELAAAGFKPSTSRGQNFLLDPSLHRWIAEQAGPTAADTVVEIGVGLGFLTRELAARAGKLLAVEIEPRLLAIAKRELAGADNIEWLLEDALGGPGRTLATRIAEVAEACTGRLLVIANLPYSVSGPMLAELAQLSRLPDRIVVLVQKELGQRLAASHGSDRRTEVPAELLPAPARRRFSLFLRKLFGQRRKALRRTFALAKEALERPDAVLREEWSGKRAEALSPDELVQLWGDCEGRSDS